MKATAAMAAQSYSKAVNGSSCVNDAKVISQFAERGIDATPRVDVFTYNIWRHQKGRQVMKGACVCPISQTQAVSTTDEAY